MEWFFDEKVRLGILFAGMFIFGGIEFIVPLRAGNRLHTVPNISLMISLIVINTLFSTLSLFLGTWAETYHFGLLRWVDVPISLQVIIGLIALDFWAAYLSHYLFHKIKWLWRFHSVHHSDTMVDVTTAFRQHPVESVFRISFHISGMVLIGIPFWILFVYLALSGMYAELEHANIKIPSRIDTFLQYIIVTPNMHKLHHSKFQAETDSNYSNIFSFWDRIFGTYRSRKDYTDVQYGLDYLDELEKRSFWMLIKLPFKKRSKS